MSAGDRVAFGEYVRSRSPALLRAAQALVGNRADAEDLLQATLVKAYQSWDKIDDPAALDTYVRRVMLNTHISGWRKRRVDEYPTDELLDSPSAEDATGDSDLHDVVQRAIDRLPRQMRAAVMLRFYDDMTEPEVAAALGVSVGTVKSTVARAVAKLRKDAELGADPKIARGQQAAAPSPQSAQPTVATAKFEVSSLLTMPSTEADSTGVGSRLSDVRARLIEAASTGDTRALLNESTLTEIQTLVGVLDTSDGLEASFALGWLYWYLYLTLGESQGSSALEACLALLTPCFIAGWGELPGPLVPVLAERAVPTAVKFLEQALNSSDSMILSESVSLWQRISGAVPASDSHAPMWLSNLGVALRVRFERTGEIVDLDSAIEVGRAAVAALPADHIDRAKAISNLGRALAERFERTGEIADLDSAIEAGRAAVAALPTDHPGHAAVVSDLGGTLLTRYLRTGSRTDLNAAVDAARTAANSVLTQNPERAKYLSNLGRALAERFERTGEIADLDSAIEAGRAAVAALPADHPDLGAAMANLQRALQDKDTRTGS
jgi:RNA polymerase sigma-70 factor (sigma-E family)